MASMQCSIGVVVLEPNKQLLERLCLFAQSVWGKHEVLPRQTGKELKSAADRLNVGLVVVRASHQRSSASISDTLFELYLRGTQILVIQDTAAKFSERTWTSMAGIHFLSDQAGDEQLTALLGLTLVQHAVPVQNRLV
jgi:hypothetical protein